MAGFGRRRRNVSRSQGPEDTDKESSDCDVGG